MIATNTATGKDIYARAQRAGQKQAKELAAAGKKPNPEVLDELLSVHHKDNSQYLGLVDIPTDKVVGVVSAGRIPAFSAGFLPLLREESEFAKKWIHLCDIHLSEEGIRDPIECVEYLGNFYIQEGNKRFSVLKYFGATKISAIVRRIMPQRSDSPRIIAYREFLEFYKASKSYDVQFTEPGMYAQLLSFLGKVPGEPWTEQETKAFSSRFYYFKTAYDEVCNGRISMLPEEALLLWLQIHPFHDLRELTHEQLKYTLVALWGDIVAQAYRMPMQVKTDPVKEGKTNLLSRIFSAVPDHLAVAFVHQRDCKTSFWTKAHEEGRQYLEKELGDKVTTKAYFHADTPEQAETILNQAVADGAQVVFTTTPQLSRATLKAAVQFPKVQFLNCSADAPFSSFSSYYCRAYEGKFITGAIAGAMAKNNRIGYVGSYPIFGVPASINAFALGAQLTNPEARVELRWSCVEGNPVKDFIDQGIRVISNRDVPSPHRKYLEFGEYGTYCVTDSGELEPLGSPCWLWGTLYVNMIRSILSGSWDKEKTSGAVNYWWGMDSGVTDVKLTQNLPEGLMALANILRDGLKAGTIDPFRRKIIAQDGSVKNDGTAVLSPDEVLHMDWLCENVDGRIPQFSEIASYSQSMVRQLGIYRDSIPKEKEGNL